MLSHSGTRPHIIMNMPLYRFIVEIKYFVKSLIYTLRNKLCTKKLTFVHQCIEITKTSDITLTIQATSEPSCCKQLSLNTQSCSGSTENVGKKVVNGAVMRTGAHIQLCVRLWVCHASRCQFPLPSTESEPAPLGLGGFCLLKWSWHTNVYYTSLSKACVKGKAME